MSDLFKVVQQQRHNNFLILFVIFFVGCLSCLLQKLLGNVQGAPVQFVVRLGVLLDQLNTNLSVTVTFVYSLVTLKMVNVLPVHILESRVCAHERLYVD